LRLPISSLCLQGATMVKQAFDWPPWWNWEIDLWTHLEEKMEERGFTEVDLRRMLEYAAEYRRVERVVGSSQLGIGGGTGKSLINVQPEPDREILGVVTAYEVTGEDR